MCGAQSVQGSYCGPSSSTCHQKCSVSFRPAADMWIQLQAHIETACLEGVPIAGCMTDIIKAFNGLPRVPLLRAAARLGFPREFLGLQLDQGKTYFWATQPADRKLLVLLGLSVAEHRRELGGFLTFGPRHRVADMAQRAELLQPMWQVLRRSRAPMRRKWTAVTTKLCQVWCCFRDFRRLANKSRGLLDLWVGFAQGFRGKEYAGPFSAMHHHAQTLNWGFAEPPMFTDHRGLTHDFLKLPKRTLRRVVEDACMGAEGDAETEAAHCRGVRARPRRAACT